MTDQKQDSIAYLIFTAAYDPEINKQPGHCSVSFKEKGDRDRFRAAVKCGYAYEYHPKEKYKQDRVQKPYGVILSLDEIKKISEDVLIADIIKPELKELLDKVNKSTNLSEISEAAIACSNNERCEGRPKEFKDKLFRNVVKGFSKELGTIEEKLEKKSKSLVDEITTLRGKIENNTDAAEVEKILQTSKNNEVKSILQSKFYLAKNEITQHILHTKPESVELFGEISKSTNLSEISEAVAAYSKDKNGRWLEEFKDGLYGRVVNEFNDELKKIEENLKKPSNLVNEIKALKEKIKNEGDAAEVEKILKTANNGDVQKVLVHANEVAREEMKQHIIKISAEPKLADFVKNMKKDFRKNPYITFADEVYTVKINDKRVADLLADQLRNAGYRVFDDEARKKILLEETPGLQIEAPKSTMMGGVEIKPVPKEVRHTDPSVDRDGFSVSMLGCGSSLRVAPNVDSKSGIPIEDTTTSTYELVLNKKAHERIVGQYLSR